MPDKKVSVTRLSDIEVGEYYLVRGTDSSGMPIPPQIAHIKAPPRRTVAFGVPTVKCEVMAKIGKQLIRYDTEMDLWSINVKEGGTGSLSGHGLHDREMIRMTHPDQLKQFMGDESYAEIIQQKKDAPRVIKSTKFGEK